MFCMFVCCTYRQVSSRRPVPLSRRLKGVSGSRSGHVMKARPCNHARATAVSIGSRARPPLQGMARAVCPLSSLRRTSARLRLLERRTTARFLQISPRSTITQLHQHHRSTPQHSGLSSLTPNKRYPSSEKTGRTSYGQKIRSDTTLRKRYLSHGDHQKGFYSRYVRAAVEDQSRVRHSARLVDRSQCSDQETLEDVTRTFICRRLSPRRLDDDGRRLLAAGTSDKTLWQRAILRRSDDGGLGRFVICRSPPQSGLESGHGRRPSKSADIYGPRYSSPAAVHAAVTSSTSRAGCSFPTVEKPASDEHLVYRALSHSMVGSHWLSSVCRLCVWHVLD